LGVPCIKDVVSHKNESLMGTKYMELTFWGVMPPKKQKVPRNGVFHVKVKVELRVNGYR